MTLPLIFDTVPVSRKPRPVHIPFTQQGTTYCGQEVQGRPSSLTCRNLGPPPFVRSGEMSYASYL